MKSANLSNYFNFFTFSTFSFFHLPIIIGYSVKRTRAGLSSAPVDDEVLTPSSRRSECGATDLKSLSEPHREQNPYANPNGQRNRHRALHYRIRMKIPNLSKIFRKSVFPILPPAGEMKNPQ